MQNKGIVKFIAAALVLVCIFYLSYSFVTRYHENKAAAMGEKAGQEYLDSLSSKDANVWFGSNLKKCREMEIGLGLDLKGGMNVILEVSVPDIVDMLADHKQDAGYRKVLSMAKKEEERTQGDFVTIFYNLWKQEMPDRNLSTIFATSQMRDKVNTNTPNDEVISALRTEVQSAIDNAETVVRTRVDRFGVVQPNIQRLEGQSRIMIEMPGVKEPERVRKLLQGSANLEFYETYDAQNVLPMLNSLSTAYAAQQRGEQPEEVAAETAETEETVAQAEADTTKVEEADADAAMAEKISGAKDDAADNAQSAEALERMKKQNPLFAYLDTRYAGLSVIGGVAARDTADVNKIIYSDLARKMLPADLKLLWGVKPTKHAMGSTEVFELYAIKLDPSGKAPLSGDVITKASDSFNQFNNPVVSMQMNTVGTRKWATMTRENKGHAIAIVLDDMVYSAPRVNDEITGGSSEISGDFTLDETKDLANTLNSGKMPAPTRIVQEQVVGPTLGAQSIKQGAISFVIALILLGCVMVLLYGFIPGMLANTALLFNLFFTLGILASFQAALTMPGIAGIVLTLGTAVDANVLIYERTKEELRRGLNIKEAMNKGYSNAFSAIFDSNLTSLITGIILFSVGTGPIKGFATTWIIGICIAFFTAVFMTRLVYDHQMKRDRWQNLTFSTSFSKNLMQGTHFNFMGMYKKSYMIWGIAAVLFCVSFLVRGLSKSIDFTGGRNYVIVLDKETPVEDVRSALRGVFVNTTGVNEGKEATTTAIALGAASDKTVRISTNWNIESNDPTVDDQAEDIIYETLKKGNFISQASIDDFKNPDVREGGSIISSSKVGPSIAKSITRGAIISVILALIAIFLYILLRFRNVAFSIGSIVALAFDALIVIGFFSVLWGWVPMSLEVDQTFIGAILTVIGYSINDKVVVFDRIRENIGLYGKRDRRQLFNDSLNQTLARTVNTSVTTLVVLLTIFIFGGDSIRPFSFAMILGVVFGTLSSIFIAAPTAYLWLTRGKNNVSEETEKKK